MRWTKTLRCCAPYLAERLGEAVLVYIGPCEGEVEADHAGAHGLSRKSDDSTVIPLCVRHHREPGLRHLLHGKVPRGTVRTFLNAMIVRFSALWSARRAA